MATQAAKVLRRAEALNELSRLSELLADSLKVELPDVKGSHRDPELAEILRIESINGLLKQVLEASGVEVKEKSEFDGLSKAELLELAEERGIEIAKSHTKAEIVEALEIGKK